MTQSRLRAPRAPTCLPDSEQQRRERVGQEESQNEVVHAHPFASYYLSKYRYLSLSVHLHFYFYLAQHTDPNTQEPKFTEENYQLTLVAKQFAPPLWQR